MSYEYKESLKEDLQHLYEIPTGAWKYKERLEELDEVYAKAQAFDDVIELQKLKIERFKKRIDSTDDLYFKDKYCNSIERAENIIHVLGSHLP